MRCRAGCILDWKASEVMTSLFDAPAGDGGGVC